MAANVGNVSGLILLRDLLDPGCFVLFARFRHPPAGWNSPCAKVSRKYTSFIIIFIGSGRTGCFRLIRGDEIDETEDFHPQIGSYRSLRDLLNFRKSSICPLRYDTRLIRSMRPQIVCECHLGAVIFVIMMYDRKVPSRLTGVSRDFVRPPYKVS